MHITLSMPSELPVPPERYGGTERIAYWLGKAFLELGHQVTLIAHPDSHIPGAELRPIADPSSRDRDQWLKLIPDHTDIVQFLWVPEQYPKKPFVISLRGIGRPGQRFHPNTLFVSRRHAANHGSRHFVCNGVDPADYDCSPEREDYAVFLAKARWNVKNLDGAIQVAREAGIPLHVVGSRNWPWNLQRFLPPIRGVHYHGMFGGEEKRKLLARARCLILPVRWEEPCAVALFEALASGCYVAGTPYGCLPEIVSPEVGVLAAHAAKLADAVRNPQRFNPQTCRNRITGTFNSLNMARNYLRYYERVLATGRLGDPDEPAPQTAPGLGLRELLPWNDNPAPTSQDAQPSAV